MAFLSGTQNNDFLRAGHTEYTFVSAGAGDDEVYGSDAGTTIYGGFGNDYLFGGEKTDWIYGGDDLDHMYGFGGRDFMLGGNGDDLLDGGDGWDVLAGQKGDDFLFGGAHNDVLWGGEGKDHLEGQQGNDNMSGGSDADVFVFKSDEGRNFDTVSDFEVEMDVIHMQTAAVDSMDDIALFQHGDDAMISFEDDVLILEGVNIQDLSADNFHFEESTLYL